ncbi:MAG: ATP-binding cassette domain-containing protein [Lachnospiraceae bacterium]|nr:ATP-binding cassette domain-containing protein [Lachnospiraceae bacterium]
MSVIEIRNLVKTFEVENNKVVALDGVSLSVEKGDIYGIIGMSGAGKSTLVRTINYLEKPTEGTVRVDGVDLSKLRPAELRKMRAQIGMIFQGFNLIEQRSVLGNVCFPLELAGIRGCEAKEKARHLLNLVGLAEKEKAYPSQLSGGQKQRVAIARALATDPRILLCDEATSALDPQTTTSILNLLREINERLGITIVIITHQMSVVTEVCNKVAIVDGGRLVESGSVEEIFASPKSDAAKELILGKEIRYTPVEKLETKSAVRIVFKENSAYEPVLANVILKTRQPVNILKADTRNINGKAVGEMILGLPEDEQTKDMIIGYLKETGLIVTEVSENEYTSA